MKKSLAPLLTVLWIFGFMLSLQAQSPERLFYSSFRPEGWDIYISRDQGKTIEQFTDHPTLDYSAAISPNGRWVVFTSERDGTPKLYIKPIEGDKVPRLLVSSNSMQDQLTFSPDGSWITFVSTHEGNADIYRLPFIPDSTLNIEEARKLTNHPGGDFRPSIAPDGQTIAFSSDREHPIKSRSDFPFAMQRTGDIFTMDSAGDSLQRLTDSEEWDGSPQWSPDGTHIYFYSLRSGPARIYNMNKDGTEQSALSPDDLQAASPVPISDSTLVFVNWTEVAKNQRPFRLMLLNIKSGQIYSLFSSDIDLFDPDVHSSGLMAFHGGPKPVEKMINKGGFNGELLVKGNPFHYQLPGKTLEGYGIRRAFAAPPSPNGPNLVFETFRAEGQMDKITIFGYAIFLLPVLTLLFFLTGIFLSVKNRKSIKFWCYLLFSLASVLFMTILLGSFYYFISKLLPLLEVRLYMIGITIVFALLGWISWRVWQRRLEHNDSSYRVSRLMTIVLSVNILFALYLTLLTGHLLDLDSDFFSVNYETGDIESLFTYHADQSIPPHFNLVLDTKYTLDGSAIVFSTGSFRSTPSDPGDIWKYDINQEELRKISTSDANDGFADFTADGSTMVYRSGKGGNMDLYLRKDGSDTQLTDTPDKENFPAISPDGNAVVYTANSNGTETDSRERTVNLFLIKKNDDNSWSSPVQLTSYEGQEAHPHFSPDGKWIVYATEEFGINDEEPLVQSYIFSPQVYGEIVAMRLSNGKKIRLTHNKWEEGAPLWVKGY